MKVVVIEDEPLMADELENEIRKVDPTIQIIGKFSSIADTVSYLSDNETPDLFFSDIQLSDGLSFEIFKKLDELVPIVFCTAFDDYAIEAFKSNGIDYILKPFDNDAIFRTIEKYKTLTNQGDFSKELSNLFQSLKEKEKKSTLLVNKGSRIVPIKHTDIRLAYLQNGITRVITKDNKSHIVNHSLDKLEGILGEDFFRTNRQTIVHKDAVVHVSPFFARKLLLEINVPFEDKVVISKANSRTFLRWLES